MRREERKKIWLSVFQTRLLMRIGVYWFIYMITLLNLLFVWRLVIEGPGDTVEQFGRLLTDNCPALVLFALLLPAVAWDSLKFSHRLVGPVVRFRQTLQDMAAGQPVNLIRLRDGDYLTEMRDEFNAMLEALQRMGLPIIKPADPGKDNQQRHTA